MEKLSLSKAVCIVFAFCAATAIASPAQTFTTLASFNGTNGENPASSLIQATDGNFYGTTTGGGPSYGTIFKFSGNSLNTLFGFSGTNGAYPYAKLAQWKTGVSMEQLLT